MLRSKVCEALGIRYPIFQGGMAWVSDGRLAAAVSNAGGLGIISAMNADENYVRDQIRLCREQTDAPFGVNIMLMSPHVQAVAELVCEEKVPVVTTGAGLPGKYMPAWIEAGIKVVPLVGPSSIIMAVMASGLSGQSFAFNGYLPVKEPERTRTIKRLESRATGEHQSQLFIEAPYRNTKLAEQIISSCGVQTKLCIACDITSKNEYIRTATIGEWRKSGVPDINKRPTIFIIGE
jgi:hypothetical protein